ncbi:BnaC03g13690D [Brassica napus]|uniref:MATH domain-containing protein n=2 Tax=Brassica TaxID=3705 RepID=A0A3P6A6Y1_BRAOL|nr:unnamed protein product [Brassica napus]CDY11943.1 BnaC03g13690D [Brassica napus]VDC87797.1 unnamed protein product [Brassica oleracea]
MNAALAMMMTTKHLRRNSSTNSNGVLTDSTNINGFVVELWDERLVRWIFKTYPETALNVQCQNPEQRTYFMNVLLYTIRILVHKRPLSDAELITTSKNLRYLTEAGFKVEWLWSKLEMKKHEAYLDRKKRDSCEARIVKLKLELKKLDGAMSGLKAELKNEEAKLNPRSFRNLLGNCFCL